MSAPPKKPVRPVPSPVVSFTEAPAGRDTLTAIAEERGLALFPMAHRAPASTKHYGDRISNAPGAFSPKVARAMDTAPKITVTVGTAGRETYAAIAEDDRDGAPSIEISEEVEVPLPLDLGEVVIEQIHTFVLRGRVKQFTSEAVQRELIETRLVTQMRGCGMEDVNKVEVRSGSEPETVLFRVWTTVP